MNLVGYPTQDAVDRYGRTLEYVVRPDGFDYSVEAARSGVAKSYIFDNHPVARYGEIAAAEEQARTTGAGLWAHRASVPPTPFPAHRLLNPRQRRPRQLPLPAGVYFKNCRAAWDAGAAPLYRGDAGYRNVLDGDSDGKACEVRPK